MHENVERNMAGYEFADHISDFKKFMALAAYFSHTIVGGDGNSSISFCSELHYPRAVYSIHLHTINECLERIPWDEKGRVFGQYTQ